MILSREVNGVRVADERGISIALILVGFCREEIRQEYPDGVPEEQTLIARILAAADGAFEEYPCNETSIVADGGELVDVFACYAMRSKPKTNRNAFGVLV